MQQPARNAEASAGEHATLALVEEVLSADSDDILEEVKTRGSWRTAAEAITYGNSSSANAEGAPAAEKVAGNADASPAPALEEAERRIAELERKLAASELREVEANERVARAGFSANLQSQDVAARAASRVEAAESSAADADAREREHAAVRAKTALAAAAGAPDEAPPKGTPRRAPGREGGVEKRGAAKSPAEKSPTPRSQRAVAEEFASAASDEEDADMDGSTTTAPPNPRSRQKKKSRAED